MTYLIVVVVIVIGAVVALRARKLARDRYRENRDSKSAGLLDPPASPYTPSKGFRIVNGSGEVESRPRPSSPRIDPSHQYVFSDSQPSNIDSLAPLSSRHDVDWYLSRSSHRDPGVRTLVIFVILLVALLVTVGIFYYAGHHSGDTTTTTALGSEPMMYVALKAFLNAP